MKQWETLGNGIQAHELFQCWVVENYNAKTEVRNGMCIYDIVINDSYYEIKPFSIVRKNCTYYRYKKKLLKYTLPKCDAIKEKIVILDHFKYIIGKGIILYKEV